MSGLSDILFPLDTNLTLPVVPPICIQCTPDVFNEDVSFIRTKLPLQESPVFEAQVSSAKLLSDGEDVKKVFELLLDQNENVFSYLPGDSIGILPQNPDAEVDALLKRLCLFESSYKIEVLSEASKKKKLDFISYIPPAASSKYLFKRCLDLRAVIKKGFIRSLVEYTSDEIERRRLKELCSKEGSSDYNLHILNKKCSLMDVLEAFPSCQPPLSLVLEHLPPLQPRPYSIASSPLECPGKIRIVFNAVFDNYNRRGICSGWLSDILAPFTDLTYRLDSLNLNDSTMPLTIPIYLRKPTLFRIPENSSLPLIMIGPGTGVAPFLGFLEHRRKQLVSNTTDMKAYEKNWLLFGCRYPHRDEIYRDTFKKFESEGVCYYLVSYSRFADKEVSFKYVQDILKDKKEEIIGQLLSTETLLFICGDGMTMGKQVLEVLTECIKTVKGVSDEEAKSIVTELEKNGKIVKDIWA